MLNWSGNENSIYDEIKSNWSNNILLSNTKWNKAIHDGVYSSDDSYNLKSSNNSFSDSALELSKIKSSNFELLLYSKIGMGDGQQANNPWLQEFPDPLTRATWDNYLTISEFDARENGLYLEPSTFFNQSRNDADGGLNGKYAIIKLGKKEIKAPVLIQPGQARGTLGLALSLIHI